MTIYKDSIILSRLNTRSLQFCLILNSAGYIDSVDLVIQFSKKTLRFVYNISSVKFASNPGCTVCIENKETCTFTMGLWLQYAKFLASVSFHFTKYLHRVYSLACSVVHLSVHASLNTLLYNPHVLRKL